MLSSLCRRTKSKQYTSNKARILSFSRVRFSKIYIRFVRSVARSQHYQTSIKASVFLLITSLKKPFKTKRKKNVSRNHLRNLLQFINVATFLGHCNVPLRSISLRFAISKRNKQVANHQSLNTERTVLRRVGRKG